jgi:hypothetical protein
MQHPFISTATDQDRLVNTLHNYYECAAKRPYRGGRQKHRVKVKNRKHEAFQLVMDSYKQDALMKP